MSDQSSLLQQVIGPAIDAWKWLCSQLFPKLANPLKLIIDQTTSTWSPAGNIDEQGKHANFSVNLAIRNEGKKRISLVAIEVESPKSTTCMTNIQYQGTLQPDETIIRSLFFVTKNRPWGDSTAVPLRFQVVDDLGRRWRVKAKVCPRTSGPKPVTSTKEDLSRLTDDIELAVATILKSELVEYGKNGRVKGEQGSVFRHGQLQLDCRPLAALAQLAAAPDGAKEKVFDSLLKRLKEMEYQNVAYLVFAFCILSRTSIPTTLNHLLESLKDTKSFAFGDCMLLLDHLVKQDSSRFSDEDLRALQRTIPIFSEFQEYAISERVLASVNAEIVKRLGS